MNLAIVIATYNEAANVAELLVRLQKTVPGARVVIVDDDSPDGTAALAGGFGSTLRVDVIVRVGERGMGGALVRGLKAALAGGADTVVTMDADLSHAPEDIPRLIAAAADHQLVLGSRRVDGGSVVGWSRGRDLVSRFASGLSRQLLGLKTRDVTTGFRAYRADLLRQMDLAAVSAKGYAFQEEMVMRVEAGGFSVCEVPINFIDRRAGKSKLSLAETFSSFGALLRLRIKTSARRKNITAG